MKRAVTLLMVLAIFGLTNVFAQSESTNLPPSGLKPVSTKAWVTQFSHTTIPTSGSYGAESDGTHIYITKWSGDTIWKYTPAGVLVSSFTIPGVTGLRDLAYDGTYFYGGNNGTAIYQMDFTNATLVSTISAAAAGTGVTVRNICWEPSTDAFWVGAWGSNLALISKTGTLLSTIPAATHGQTSMAGSAYDTLTPGGPYIWIITAGSTPAEIHQINVATGQSGTMHFTTDDVNATAQGIGGGLFITENLIAGTATLGGMIQNELLFGYDLGSVIPDSFDISMESLDILSQLVTNQAVQIKGEVKNKGLISITNFDLAYRVDGGAVQQENKTGLNIASGQSYNFTHSVNWTPTTAGSYTLEVWANQPNGNPDMNTANDTLVLQVVAFDTIVEKKVLIEQATGAWCGYCPDGGLVLNQILANHPNTVMAAAIHNGDAMAFTDGNAVNTAFSPSFPNAYIDRFLFSDQTKVGMTRSIWTAKTTERLNAIVPCVVEAHNIYNASNKTITIDLTATFYTDITGDFRVNAYIVEDSVVGSGTGWDQTNYYNTTSGHPYYGAGNPILGYKHRHVLRAMLGGPWGSTGVISSPISKYDSFTKQYTYAIPTGVTPNRLTIIVLVQEYNSAVTQRPILNSEKYYLGVIDGIQEENLNGDLLSLYPNPASDVAHVEFMLTNPAEVTMEVVNLLGERVQLTNLGTLPVGEHYHALNVNALPAGVYILKANFGGNARTQKFVVQ